MPPFPGMPYGPAPSLAFPLFEMLAVGNVALGFALHLLPRPRVEGSTLENAPVWAEAV